MRLPDEPEPQLQINIVPMIDVIFAVLIFFILSSLFLIRAEGLPVNLPTASSAQSQVQRQVTVTITVDGGLYLGDQSVTDDQLLAAIQTLLPQGGGLVIIRADQQVNYGRVVKVMDQLRQLNGVQLAIATQPPGSP